MYLDDGVGAHARFGEYTAEVRRSSLLYINQKPAWCNGPGFRPPPASGERVVFFPARHVRRLVPPKVNAWIAPSLRVRDCEQ